MQFANFVWPDIAKGNRLEEKIYGHIKDELDLTEYNAARQALDITAFHTFVKYLVDRGPDDDWIKDKKLGLIDKTNFCLFETSELCRKLA